MDVEGSSSSASSSEASNSDSSRYLHSFLSSVHSVTVLLLPSSSFIVFSLTLTRRSKRREQKKQREKPLIPGERKSGRVRKTATDVRTVGHRVYNVHLCTISC